MAKKLLTLILLIALASCSRHDSENIIELPILSSISIVDRNGMTETISQNERLKQFENVNFSEPQPYQKVLRVYNRSSQGDITAQVTSYHPNGQVKQYLEIVNNRAFGAYREWYVDGVLKLEATVIGGTADLTDGAETSWLFDQCSRAWDENGNLIANIDYCKGELNGFSLYYHANGNLWKRVPFNKNQIHGVFEIYLDNGNLLQTSEYVNGIKHGPSIRYWTNGTIAAKETYTQGLLNEGLYYHLSGDLVSSIKEGNGLRAVFGKDFVCELHEHRKGLEEGEIKFYDRNGNLVQLHYLKDGLKHGVETEFQYLSSENIKPKFSINWVEGKIQGIVKSWYPNGLQESQREMSNNVKNGLLTAWYEDGSLMIIEEYEQDKLIKGKYFKKGDKIPITEVIAGSGIATIFDSKGNFIRKTTYYYSKPQD